MWAYAHSHNIRMHINMHTQYQHTGTTDYILLLLCICCTDWSWYPAGSPLVWHAESAPLVRLCTLRSSGLHSSLLVGSSDVGVANPMRAQWLPSKPCEPRGACSLHTHTHAHTQYQHAGTTDYIHTALHLLHRLKLVPSRLTIGLACWKHPFWFDCVHCVLLGCTVHYLQGAVMSA